MNIRLIIGALERRKLKDKRHVLRRGGEGRGGEGRRGEGRGGEGRGGEGRGGEGRGGEGREGRGGRGGEGRGGEGRGGEGRGGEGRGGEGRGGEGRGGEGRGGEGRGGEGRGGEGRGGEGRGGEGRGGEGRGEEIWLHVINGREIGGGIFFYLPAQRCSAMNKARLTGFPASIHIYISSNLYKECNTNVFLIPHNDAIAHWSISQFSTLIWPKLFFNRYWSRGG